MKALAREDILLPHRYEQVRGDYRARMIAHKAERRVEIGDRISMVFEDRETIRYQIQEMARVEGDPGGDRIQGELDIYNELVPAKGELSATLFIEIPQLEQIRSELERLVGIDDCVALRLGEDPESSTRVRAEFDHQQLEADRISAVHYLRFRLTEHEISRLEDGERARLEVDHPNYRCDAEIGDPLRAQLLCDLRDRPAQLLDPASVPVDPGPEVVRETAHFRILRAPHARAAEHLVIEGRGPARSIAEASPKELAPLLEAAQQLAREMRERHSHCRILADVHPHDTDRPLRIDLLGY